MKLLAQDRLAEACAQLDEPNCYGRVWTPELILEIVHDTYSPDTLFYRDNPEGPVFTDPDGVKKPPYKGEVSPFNDGRGYCLDYDVPLNGEWSDLTAQFEFFKRPNGLAVVLDDLHVM